MRWQIRSTNQCFLLNFKKNGKNKIKINKCEHDYNYFV